jgi:hypothetical protein
MITTNLGRATYKWADKNGVMRYNMFPSALTLEFTEQDARALASASDQLSITEVLPDAPAQAQAPRIYISRAALRCVLGVLLFEGGVALLVWVVWRILR